MGMSFWISLRERERRCTFVCAIIRLINQSLPSTFFDAIITLTTFTFNENICSLSIFYKYLTDYIYLIIILCFNLKKKKSRFLLIISKTKVKKIKTVSELWQTTLVWPLLPTARPPQIHPFHFSCINLNYYSSNLYNIILILIIYYSRKIKNWVTPLQFP